MLRESQHLLLAVLAVVLSVLASGHAILHKRDSRAAIAWVGLIWLVPFGGAALYSIFGINRLRRRAVSLRGNLARFRAHSAGPHCAAQEVHLRLPAHAKHLDKLAQVVEQVVERPLVTGNTVEPLVNGDEAYPAMLEAIARAKRSVSLLTYIFDRDEAGLAFARTLGEAARRGVEVRVLIDATGTRYSWPSILRALRREKVRHAQFLPYFALSHLLAINLRTHRKIMVVDGVVGFTGGMNIRAGHCLSPDFWGVADHRWGQNKEKGARGAAPGAVSERGPSPEPPVSSPPKTRSLIQDLHFRVTGPVVTQMQEAFADDWQFTTGEALRSEAWFPAVAQTGSVLCRGVSDGPDEDFEKLRWTLLGALSLARESVKILTPYFLPDTGIISALITAVLRGVKVDIILPAQSNLPPVQWASQAMWWQVLEHGCRIWVTAPPFDHSKLMLVDDCWALVGSANWDARSLRLNFEYNLECYDAELARRLGRLVEEKLKNARQVTLEQMDARPLAVKLRDGIARLLTPYL